MSTALQTERPSHLKVATASLIGTAIEWYDFFLYGAAAAASIFAGALSPIIATWLMTTYKTQTWPISVYMVILALITLVSVYFVVETRHQSPAIAPGLSNKKAV